MRRTLLKAGFLIVLLTSLATTIKAITAVTSGNWTDPLTWGGMAPGGAVSGQDIVIPAGITVTLDTDVTFSGLLNSFTVDGTLMGAGMSGLTIDQGPLAGSGTVDVEWITFNLLGSSSFSGTLTANKLKNAGATLVLNNVVNVSDTLNLDAGSILLNAGANFTPMANSTIRVNNGTITIGGGVFNTGSNYNVMYVGASKTTGIELNTTMLDHLHVMLNDNSQVLTLGANLTVNNIFHLTTGTIDISGRTLTLKNDAMIGTGAMITSNNLTNLIIQGVSTLSNALAFTAGAAVNDLTIDLSGAGASVQLMSPLNIAGHLNLNDGELMLQAGSTLTVNSGSIVHVEDGMLTTGAGMFVGTATYHLEYMGGSMTTNEVAMGTGLTNLTINLTPATSVITMGSNVKVMGVFTLTNGKLALNGKKLDLEGTYNQMMTSSIIADAAAELAFNLNSVSGDTVYFEANSMLDTLMINNAGGNIVFASAMKIVNQLNLMNGKLVLMNGDLTILSTGSIVGHSETRYIATAGIGKLQMNVTAAAPYVLFPVGTVTNYSPASIQQTSFGTSGNFKIGTTNEVFSLGLTGINIAATNSMVARTWYIEADPSVSVYSNIKLGWLPASEMNGFDRTDAYVSHYTASAWDTYTESAATAGPNGTYELVRPNVTVLNTAAFAVMDTTAVIGIEEIVNSAISLYPNPAQDVITLDVNNSTEEFTYEVLDLSGRTIISVSKNSTGKVDVSSLATGTYFFKATGKTSGKVISKRFVKA